jgi:Cu-processing system permease protein
MSRSSAETTAPPRTGPSLPRAILTMAHLTFTDARRKRLLAAALVLGAAFVAVFAIALHFVALDARTRLGPPRDAFVVGFVLMAALYAANFLIVMTSVLVAVDTLAGEIGSGVVETLCTKPIPRAAVVLGKWAGCSLLLVLYAVVLCGGTLLVGRVVGRYTPPNAAAGVGLMLLEGLVLLTLTMAGGTRLSTVANGVTIFGLFGLAFIGGWMEQVGTLVGNATARYVGISASLLVPSEALWQLAAHIMQPPVVRDVNLTPFSPASVPSPAMLAWAAAHLVITLGAAVLLFRRRDL